MKKIQYSNSNLSKIKTNLFLTIFCLIICACSDDKNDSFISISGTDVVIDATAKILEYELTSNVDWEIEGNTDWCTVSQSKGTSGVFNVRINVSANFESQRFTTIKILDSDNKALYASIVITQQAAESTAEILSFIFYADKNSKELISDIIMEIKDNKISGRIPYYCQVSNLVATVEYKGEQLYVNDVKQSDKNIVDNFSKEVNIKVKSSTGEESNYSVNLTNFTGLPVVFISTNRVPISDKVNWIDATVSIDGAGKFESVMLENVSIRGRGNSTWTSPKKPYAIKLNKKTELLGMPKHKRWVLLANYYDKTAMRNKVGFDLGKQYTDLEYTPRMEYVELFLNDVYLGLYQLGEQIKINENRVNITNDGYLLEVDGKAAAEDIVFKSPLNLTFNIKDPDVEVGGERYNYIKDYIINVENILYSDGFLDKESGYKKYVDINSFADWYLINEISRNNDAAFFTSCYMNLKPGGKLKMGPLWDFDLAFGNVNYNGNENPLGFYMTGSLWIKRMFEDPEFVNLVKEKYEKIVANENDIMQNINTTANYLHWSVIENNAKWNTLYHETWPNYAIWGSYNNEVQYMKNWLNKRMLWLKTEYPKL